MKRRERNSLGVDGWKDITDIRGRLGQGGVRRGVEEDEQVLGKVLL